MLTVWRKARNRHIEFNNLEAELMVEENFKMSQGISRTLKTENDHT